MGQGFLLFFFALSGRAAKNSTGAGASENTAFIISHPCAVPGVHVCGHHTHRLRKCSRTSRRSLAGCSSGRRSKAETVQISAPQFLSQGPPKGPGQSRNEKGQTVDNRQSKVDSRQSTVDSRKSKVHLACQAHCGDQGLGGKGILDRTQDSSLGVC